MFKLSKAAAEPQRIVLRAAIEARPAVKKGRKVVEPAVAAEPEAYVVMAPITPAMRRRAQGAIRRYAAAAEIANLEDMTADQLGDMSELLSIELTRLGVQEWGGIGDEDGQTLDVTPDRDTRFRTANDEGRPTGTVDLLLADVQAFGILDELYVRADAHRLAEKNGLSALPTGTGKAATRAKTIARLPATPKRRAAAKSAHTGSTPRKPKRPKASGRS